LYLLNSFAFVDGRGQGREKRKGRRRRTRAEPAPGRSTRSRSREKKKKKDDRFTPVIVIRLNPRGGERGEGKKKKREIIRDSFLSANLFRVSEKGGKERSIPLMFSVEFLTSAGGAGRGEGRGGKDASWRPRRGTCRVAEEKKKKGSNLIRPVIGATEKGREGGERGGEKSEVSTRNFFRFDWKEMVSIRGHRPVRRKGKGGSLHIPISSSFVH